MKNRIVTISREFGSGGRTIGKKVAEKLGIPCYDSELIQKIAEESGFAENYVKEAGEYAPGGFLSSVLANRAFGPTNEDILWETQCRGAVLSFTRHRINTPVKLHPADCLLTWRDRIDWCLRTQAGDHPCRVAGHGRNNQTGCFKDLSCGHTCKSNCHGNIFFTLFFI